jgi:hypothetical protein
MIYTDYFDAPLAPGDEVIYPIASGSSSATYNRGIVDEFIDLVPHRDARPGDDSLMREDQALSSDPTRFNPREFEKKYLIKLRTQRSRWRAPQPGDPTWSDKQTTLRRCHLAIRVPDSQRLGPV